METDATLINYLTTKKKVDDLFLLPRITPKDTENFNKMETDYLAAIATEKLNQLTGAERENFLSKIEQIVPASTKSQFWEHNHFLITRAINKLMPEYGFMPSKTAIAHETGLSRQTVIKHLKDYKTNPDYLAEIDQFKFMAPKVLGTVFKFANKGDIRAARLYFEMVGAINKQHPGTVVNSQNNYIQINNTILSQENLKRLSAEQLNQIENVVTMVLPEGEKVG